MRISELAQQTGLSTDTIRFYEKAGLIDSSLYERSANNYRSYKPAAIERLIMIKQAKRFGFTLAELRELGTLWESGTLSQPDKIKILEEKVDQIEQHIQELAQLKHYIQAKLHELQHSGGTLDTK